jgi:LPS sulfotransferase NodH
MSPENSEDLIKAVVATRGRTGSTAVVDELGKAPLCWSTQEAFTAAPAGSDFTYYDFLPFNGWRGAADLASQQAEPELAEAYLRAMEDEARRAGSKALFFKVLSNHFQERDYLPELLAGNGFSVAYLKRRPVRQVISGFVANQRKLYNTQKRFRDEKKYRIDVEAFRWHVNWEVTAAAKDLELLRSHGIPFIEVDYETYLADRAAFFFRIFDFLGLPRAVPSPSDFLVMIEDLPATIENYDEVCAVASELGDPL